MPSVTIKTGVIAADGHEEVLTEYICDWPGCPNVAEHVVGVVRELRMTSALCSDHAARLNIRSGAGSD
jgi:hypothetical protein